MPVDVSPQLQTLAELVGGAPPRVVFCVEHQGRYEFRLADLGGDLPDVFRTVAEQALERASNLGTRLYRAGERPPEANYAVLRSSDRDRRLLREQLLEELTQVGNYAVLNSFDVFERRRPPVFYGLLFQEGERFAVFARTIGPKNVPAKSRWIGAFLDGTTFQEISPHTVLFDEDIDWIYLDDTFLVFAIQAFARVFLDRPRLERQVASQLARIREHVEIIGYEQLERRCASNINMLVKLHRIVERGAYSRWSVQRLKDYGREYAIQVDWQNDSMVFDGSPANQWNILKLLDEAWFAGALSGDHFEATGKEPA